MRNRRFHSQCVKVRVYSSRERGVGGGGCVGGEECRSPSSTLQRIPSWKAKAQRAQSPSTEAREPFFPTRNMKHGWCNSATQHTTAGTTPVSGPTWICVCVCVSIQTVYLPPWTHWQGSHTTHTHTHTLVLKPDIKKAAEMFFKPKSQIVFVSFWTFLATFCWQQFRQSFQ